MHADGVPLDSSHLFVLPPLFQSEITTCPFVVPVVCFAFCVVRLGTDAIIVMGELRELWQENLLKALQEPIQEFILYLTMAMEVLLPRARQQ